MEVQLKYLKLGFPYKDDSFICGSHRAIINQAHSHKTRAK